MSFPRQVPGIPRQSDTHELVEDVVYASADGVPLRYDHYRPRRVTGPAPAVVFVHGGAWVHGDPSQAAGNALHFARHGIATISISYRLTASRRRSTTSGARSATCARTPASSASTPTGSR